MSNTYISENCGLIHGSKFMCRKRTGLGILYGDMGVICVLK